MRSCRVVRPPVLHIKEYDFDGVEGSLSIIHQNYYSQLCKLDDKESKNIKISMVRSGLGGRFDHSSKLKVMKFKEAMNGPDSSKWKEEIKNEHKRMNTNRVWEPGTKMIYQREQRS